MKKSWIYIFLFCFLFLTFNKITLADFNIINSNSADPVDCVWSDWGTCSKSCGTGIQWRYIALEASNGGVECTGQYYQQCNTQPCPINCVWSSWSACSVTCGGGTQTRTHTTEAQWGGAECAGPSSQSCNTQHCPVDCEWSDWSACSVSCGGGTQTRYHTVEKAYGGKDCTGKSSQSCNTQYCPIDCVWSNWTPCSVTCGGGIQTRYHLSEARYYGRDCVGPSTNTCNENVCSDIGSGGFVKPSTSSTSYSPPIIILSSNNAAPTAYPTRVPTVKQADANFNVVQLFTKPTATPTPVLPTPTTYKPYQPPTVAPTSIHIQPTPIIPTPTVKPESFIPNSLGSQTNNANQQTSYTLNTQILKDIKVAINKVTRTPTEKPLLPQEQKLLANKAASSSYGGIVVSLEQKTGSQFVTQQDELTVKRGNQFFSISNQATPIQSISSQKSTNTKSELSTEQLEINANNVIARSSMGLSIDPLSGVLTIDTPTGPKKVSIMPDEALGIVLELKALNTKGVVEPTILLVSEKGSLIYRISGEKVEKFLGFFPISIRKQILVSADTGSVVKVELSLLSQILSFFTF
ncbi:MAG: thrombospondin type-1 domain-containing protein [Candidatus Roizmanbacteria bacterium]|nr:thrombospondin type-1 domain-containing protein [Candidatus Roizmanbacteria bacterium]